MIKKIISALLLIVALSITAYAAEYSYTPDEVGQYSGKIAWDKLVEELPEDISSDVKDLDPYSPQNSVESIRNKTNLSYWLNKVLNEIKSSAFGYLPQLGSVISIMMLLSMVKMFLPALIPETSNTFTSLGTITITLSTFLITSQVIETAGLHLNNICNIMNLLTPVMQAIYLAEGSLTQLAVSSSAVMLVVTVIGNINNNIMIPCTGVLFTLSAVSSVCNEVKLTDFTNSIRKFIMRTWQIVTIGFSFMLGTQTIIAQSADSLASKTVKFAIGSIIPMAGGVLAEAYNTVREGLSFVHGATGIGGIIVIVLLLIPGIIPLVLYKLIINFTSMLAEVFGLDRVAAFMNEVKGIIEIVVAIVLYTSLMLVFALILFTKSQM